MLRLRTAALAGAAVLLSATLSCNNPEPPPVKAPVVPTPTPQGHERSGIAGFVCVQSPVTTKAASTVVSVLLKQRTQSPLSITVKAMDDVDITIPPATLSVPAGERVSPPLQVPLPHMNRGYSVTLYSDDLVDGKNLVPAVLRVVKVGTKGVMTVGSVSVISPMPVQTSSQGSIGGGTPPWVITTDGSGLVTINGSTAASVTVNSSPFPIVSSGTTGSEYFVSVRDSTGKAIAFNSPFVVVVN